MRLLFAKARLNGALLVAGLAVAQSNAAVIRPTDDGRALVNPGMGWTMNYYSNVPHNYGAYVEQGDSLDWFPGCSVVYLRIPWAYLEPSEGDYNWPALDSVTQRWIARGAQVAFRITTSESWLRYATPEWVKDAGAKGVNWNFGFGEGGGPVPDGKLWDPDFADPVYLEKLENFLRAFAARYDGRDEVAFVDIGTYGMWGEGHTLGSSRVPQEKMDRDVKRHIDLHCKYFKKTQLVISDDVSGPLNESGNHPLLDYARARNVTLRDDSILVERPPKSWRHPYLAQRYWRTMPVVIEHEHLKDSIRNGAWSDDLLVKSVEDLHASYMTIHHDPKFELAYCKSAIDRINLRLGYRFQAREIEYPDEIRVGNAGEPFAVRFSFANAGVAPCYRDAYPALTLKDAKGRIVAVLADDGFNLKSLEVAAPGEAQPKEHAHTFRLGRWDAPLFVPGEYDVFVSVGRSDGTPVYELPLKDGDGHRRYRIGTVRLVYPEGRPAAACPRYNGEWPERYAERLADIGRGPGAYDVVFCGDSITHNWEEQGAETYAELCRSFRILNLGFAGDKTQDLLWRLENGLLVGYTAKRFMVTIGTNNAANPKTSKDSAEDVAEGVKAIVRKILKSHPESRVLLLPIFPADTDPACPHRKINDGANALLKAFAESEPRIDWLDFNAKLMTDDGHVNPTYYTLPDTYHPNAAGYRLWRDEVLPYFKN